MGVDLYGDNRMVVYTTANFYVADRTNLIIFQMTGYRWYSGVPYSDLIKMRNMFQNNLFAIDPETETSSESFSSIKSTSSTKSSTLINFANFPFLHTITSLIVILIYRRNT